MENYIDIPSLDSDYIEEEFIKVNSKTPERIQIVYELSRNIENNSTSSTNNP